MIDNHNDCKHCFWNFDGICASHSPSDPDTYGTSIQALSERFPDGCCEFRPTFDRFYDESVAPLHICKQCFECARLPECKQSECEINCRRSDCVDCSYICDGAVLRS